MSKIAKNISISVFFPCYNDSKTIGRLIKDATRTLLAITKDFEIIVIDDGSGDNSRKILEKIKRKNRKLKLVFHPKNLGYGGALKSGFKASSKELVFYTDGDGQYDVKELTVLLNLMTEDTNFVNGIKMSRHDYSHRVILGNLYSFICRWLFFLPTYDVDCDFRLIRKKLIDKVNLKCNSGSICIEIVKKSQRAGAKIRQVSVHHYDRKFGTSQFFKPKHLLNTLIEIFPLWIELMIIQKINLKK